MAYEPPKDFPEHGGEGNAEFGAGWPDNELTTPNVRGRRFPPVEPSSFSNDYGSHPTGHIHPPTDPDALGVGQHPFKLELREKKQTEDEDGFILSTTALEEAPVLKTLRVYYGELWHTISVIRTAALEDGFGFKGQDEIPGVERTVIPDFEHEDLDDGTQTILRYTEFSEVEKDDGLAYGTVILEWVCKADPGEEGAEEGEEGAEKVGIQGAHLILVPPGDVVDNDTNIGELARHDDNPADGEAVEKLLRVDGPFFGELGGPDAIDDPAPEDTETGIYRMVIGQSLDPEEQGPDPNHEGLGNPPMVDINEGKPLIDQQVYDHVYWAPTIVMGSPQPSPGTPPFIPPATPSWHINLVPNKTKPNKPVVIVGEKNLQDKVVINPKVVADVEDLPK